MNKAIIWDSNGPCVNGDPSATVLLWNDFIRGSNPSTLSVPDLVEKNATELRSRYLAWVYKLGEITFKGKCLIDYYELYPDCNSWWMNLFTEKCNFSKSPDINDAIKFMALISWLSENSIKDVVLFSQNKRIDKSLRNWCRSNAIAYKWKISFIPKSQFTWAHLFYRSFPYMAQALLWALHYLLNYWPIRGLGLSGWSSSTGRITFISYLLNSDISPEDKKQDFDRYWGSLPEYLKQEGCQINWLYIHVKDSLLSWPKNIIKLIEKRNSSIEKLDTHVALESFLTLDIVFKAVHIWYKTLRLGLRLKKTIARWSSENSGIDLWPFFIKDWNESMFGPTAISNAFNQLLFMRAFQILPGQSRGIYLQENQGWEFACIQAWRASQHGMLIGCPHSTVRFWDLRYFFDPLLYAQDRKNVFPRPHIVALNSELALSAFADAGYPGDELIEVEALRYLYLGCLAEMPALNHSNLLSKFHLLVFGDYLKSNSQRQLEILEGAIKLLPFQIHIIYKPHPACSINLTDYPSLNIRITKKSVTELLVTSSAAFVGPVTSAAIDAYCAGLPVISILDPNILNLSPLRNNSKVVFVTSPEQLAQALMLIKNSVPTNRNLRDYFIIDTNLPRWRKLLAE